MVTDRHQDMDLLIRWMPGHIDIKANEEADKEAKAAAKHGSSPNQKLPSQLQKMLPHSKFQQAFHAKLKQAAAKVWQNSPWYEQMKQIDSMLPSRSLLSPWYSVWSLYRLHTDCTDCLDCPRTSLRLHLDFFWQNILPILNS